MEVAVLHQQQIHRLLIRCCTCPVDPNKRAEFQPLRWRREVEGEVEEGEESPAVRPLYLCGEVEMCAVDIEAFAREGTTRRERKTCNDARSTEEELDKSRDGLLIAWVHNSHAKLLD